jgi:hypothetical protein
VGNKKQLQLQLFPTPKRRYDVAPFRIACERAIRTGQFDSWAQLAVACNWYYAYSLYGDTGRLKRTLGIQKRQYEAETQTIIRKTAHTIVNALGLDPVDFDL